MILTGERSQNGDNNSVSSVHLSMNLEKQNWRLDDSNEKEGWLLYLSKKRRAADGTAT